MAWTEIRVTTFAGITLDGFEISSLYGGNTRFSTCQNGLSWLPAQDGRNFMLHVFVTISFIFVLSLNPVAAAVVDLSRLNPPSQNSQNPQPIRNQPASQPLKPTSVRRIDLGQELVRGVLARASLVAATMESSASKSLQQNPRYRIIVTFREVKSGKELLSGQAALRLFGEDDRTLDTLRLIVEEQAWRCWVDLPKKGETMIKVGSLLDDRKKRIFRFFFSPDAQSIRAVDAK